MIVALCVAFLSTAATSDTNYDWIKPNILTEFKDIFHSLDYSHDNKVSFYEISLGIQSIDEAIISTHNYLNIIQNIPEKFSCTPSLHSPVNLIDCLTITLRTLLFHIKDFDTDLYSFLISTNIVSSDKNSIISLQNQYLTFDDAFKAYLTNSDGICDDLRPADVQKHSKLTSRDQVVGDGEYCYDIVEIDPSVCWNFGDSNEDNINQYCQLSCHMCPEASANGLYNLFSSIFHQTGRDVATYSNLFAKLIEKGVRGTNGLFHGRVDQIGQDMFYKKDLDQVMRGIGGNDSCGAVDNATNAKSQFLFISDWHAEPWYLLDGNDTVSRFPNANLTNMFECKEEVYNNENNAYEYELSNCELDGASDPPIEMIESALDFLGLHQILGINKNESILAFVGDTQAHDYTTGVNASLVDTCRILLTKCIQYMKNYVNVDYLFYTAGNNDGDHNAIFTSSGNVNVSLAWANVLIDEGVVTNTLRRKYSLNDSTITYDTIQLFQKTGYYIKQIPQNIVDETFGLSRDSSGKTSKETIVYYMIILNTNLGLSNYVQNTVFTADLEWIKSQNSNKHNKEAYAIVLGHHPEITSVIVPSEYESIVKGSLSGHVHYFKPTDSNGFTILPAVTQYSLYSAVVMGNLTTDGYVNFSYSNLNIYKGAVDTVPLEQCWA